MIFDFFERIARTVVFPNKPFNPFLNSSVEKMSSLDCKNILSQNAVPFKEDETTMTIGTTIIPKDGFSDALRLLNFVRQQTADEYQSAIVAPCLTGQLWDGEALSASYLFREHFENCTLYKPKAQAPVADPAGLAVWNGAFLGDVSKYETDDGFMAVDLPKMESFYYNFAVKKRDAKAFLNEQPDPRSWAQLECGAECVEYKHVHLVAGRYENTWDIQTEDGPKIIRLAPPIHLVAKMRKYEISKNCIASQIEKAATAMRAGINEVAQRDSAIVPLDASGEEKGATGGEGHFLRRSFKTAYEAGKELAKHGGYDDLQAVCRNANNIQWRKLDKIAPTHSGLTKLRKELGILFTSKVLVLIQKSGGATLTSVLNACNVQASRYGASKKDAIFGFYLGRLAEPCLNIVSIDGRLIILNPGEEFEEEGNEAEEWGE